MHNDSWLVVPCSCANSLTASAVTSSISAARGIPSPERIRDEARAGQLPIGSQFANSPNPTSEGFENR